jgi:EAL domain-containing protein (putative c-di-GMP-specific phosphodiesterase class I)
VRNVLTALHRSSEGDKARFIPFDSEAYERYLRTEHIEEQMLSKTFSTEISAVFQPKISVATGRCVGFEALARWHNPILGNISPGEFIPIAERNRAISEITNKIVADTKHFIDVLGEQTSGPVRIAFNLSPILLNETLLAEITHMIIASKLGNWLEIEITEGVLLGITHEIETAFTRLKKAGVTFAVDDFGTGYSNLAYLQSFEAEVIKIDKRFIDGIPKDEKNANLVRAILQLTHSLGMKSVAEGVEYAEQAQFLADEKCDQIQGYFYSKPLIAADALAWFLANTADTDGD